MQKKYDYIVIGAGPAGVQLGYYLQQKKRNYLILESGGVPGTFFKRYPRHRKLISINKVYTGFDDPGLNMRWDWNSLLSDDYGLLFKEYSKKYFPHPKELLAYLSDYVKKYKIKCKYNTKVSRISRDDDGDFIIHCSNGNTYHAKRLIMATGLTKAYQPDVPGMEYAVSYNDMTTSKKAYVNKRVLIMGKGNSAFETADHLVDTASLIHLVSPRPLKMAWRSHYPGNLRAVNCQVLDTYQLKSQNALLNASVIKIERKGEKYLVTFAYHMANSEIETIEYDAVITCTGFQFDSSIFDDSCQPELAIDDRFMALTPYYESTNIQGLYAAGNLTQVRDFKKKQSAFIHGFRYNVRFLAQILGQKYHRQVIPRRSLKADERSLCKAILKRINKTSALWQQTGFFGDVIVPSSQDERVYYYQSLPIDYVKAGYLGAENYLIITMEFGQERINKAKDVFAIERIHREDSERAHLSAAIHPVLRYYENGELKSEHHVVEDFAAVWEEPVHIKPLTQYLERMLPQLSRNLQLA